MTAARSISAARAAAIAFLALSAGTTPLVWAQNQPSRRPPEFGPPGQTPGVENPGGPHPPSHADPVSPLDEGTSNPPIPVPPDYGDAPDSSAACGVLLGIGHFPTTDQTVNAAPGRVGPYHAEPPAGPGFNAYLGDRISREPAATISDCDWNGSSCDSDDDGALVLCLSPDCRSGIALGNGVCGLGINSRFGPAPNPPYQAYWVFMATRADAGSAPAYMNVTVDSNRDGTFGDQLQTWCMKDALLPVGDNTSRVFATGPFPVTQVSTSPTGWSVDPFWSRMLLSDERVLFAFPGGDWDGSGRAGGYQIGETEDWTVQADDPQSACVVPESCVSTVAFVNIALNPIPIACVSGTQVVVSSSGRPSAALREFRLSPFQLDHPVGTQVLGLDLAGSSPPLGGTVLVRQRTDKPSFGALHRVQSLAGAMTSGVSFFDLFLEVQLPGGTILDTGALSVQVSAGIIDAFPKYNQLYQTEANAAAVPLYFKGTTNQAGWICAAGLVFAPSSVCGCAGDSNGDHSVSFADVTRILSSFGGAGATGDANADCVVNFADITSVLSNYGSTCP